VETIVLLMMMIHFRGFCASAGERATDSILRLTAKHKTLVLKSYPGFRI
jgi:hypothetical protein